MATLLGRLGATPDLLTWCGTLAAVVVSAWMIPQGWLWQASLLLTFIVLSDGLDGELARLQGRSSDWGAFLDATLDRVSDGAIFGSIIVYLAASHASPWWVGVAVAALVVGQVTSYAKARAEAQGFWCRGGLAARADRFVLLFAGMLLEGLGVHGALAVALVILLGAGALTVGQRIRQVYQQGRTPHA